MEDGLLVINSNSPLCSPHVAVAVAVAVSAVAFAVVTTMFKFFILLLLVAVEREPASRQSMATHLNAPLMRSKHLPSSENASNTQWRKVKQMQCNAPRMRS